MAEEPAVPAADPPHAPPPGAIGRAYNWTFTYQFPLDYDIEHCIQFVEEHEEDWADAYRTGVIKALIVGIETAPTTGRHHLQGAVMFRNRMSSYTAIIQALGFDYLHLETMRDRSGHGAFEYCRKEGRFFEFGDLPGKPKQTYVAQREAKRTVAKLAQEALIAEIDRDPFQSLVTLSEHRDTYINKMTFYDRYREEAQRKRTTVVRDGLVVHVYWGITGSGKTYSAIADLTEEFNEPPYIWTPNKGQQLWFDGYRGERGLLIDDLSIDGNQDLNITDFKRLIDKYPCRLAVKGGFTYAAWTHVIITTNEDPKKWFFHMPHEDYQAIQRRFTGFKHFAHSWGSEGIDDLLLA